MKVIKPLRLGVLSRCFEHERRFYFSVAILAMHQFSAALLSDIDMWKFFAEELGKEGVPDAGMAKSRAEFLVSGNAYQPNGQPAPSCDVRVQVGEREKRLRVTGDRHWRFGGDPTEPEPFVHMPITWERAFGGPKFKKNPLGKGFTAVKTENGKVYPLPNVELPNQLVATRYDRPEPATLGPIDLEWPQRFSKVGTHDKKWLQQQFPGYALDMDWSIFNLAAEDQHQLEAWRGDESFVIEGMHPTKPVLQGQLPQMKARCFVTQRENGGESFREIAMRNTTLWFFPHAERYLAVYHGTHQVAEEDGADILHLVIGAETADEPKSVEHYRAVLHQRLDPERGAIYALRDRDLLPSAPAFHAVQDEGIAQMEELIKNDRLRAKYQRRRQDREIEDARVYVAGLGLDPDLHAPPELPPDEAPPTLEELPEFIEKMQAESEQKKEQEEQRQVQQKEEFREMIAAEGLDADAIVNEPEQAPSGPPSFSADAEMENMRNMYAASVAAGAPVEELNQYANDPARREMLVNAERQMRENYRLTAHYQSAPPRFTGQQGADSRTAALNTLASSGNLARQNLTGFELSGLDWQGVDLSGAWLENANLAGTNLAGANLSEAVLVRADLTDANLAGAQLNKANLSLADLVRTRLDGADLTEGILNKTNMNGASFQGAKLESANLMEATFAETDMSQASLPNITWIKTDLRGVVLAGANLKQSSFLEANVAGVDFTEACLEEVSFVQTSGPQANFQSANMASVRFVHGCDFSGSNFHRAILNAANLRGTPLSESDFSEATMGEADLSECDLTNANLYRAFLRKALLVKARLTKVNLVSADLLNAILMNADLSSANLRAANLFQSDLARVRTDGHTVWDEANLKKARLQPKWRES